MPNNQSCKKRLRQADKANEVNRTIRSTIRSSLKSIRSAETKDAALKEMPALFKMLDKAAAKKRAGFSANRASNYKSKVSKLVNSLT